MAKSQRVVVEHLERVSWNVMDHYPDLVREMIRNRAGVYALYHGNRLYYVGLASNLMRRLKQHVRDRHRGSWDRFSVYLTVHDEHMRELESLLLRIVNPTGNAVKGKFIDSTNLKPTLTRRMRDADSLRRAMLMDEAGPTRRREPGAKRSGRRKNRQVSQRRWLKLRGRYKGHEYSAVLRKDGSIRYADRTYSSPSGAARVVVGREVNGWKFWRYRNEEGEWVPLTTLRG